MASKADYDAFADLIEGAGLLEDKAWSGEH